MYVCQTLVDVVPPLLLAKSLGVEDDAVVPADADGSTVDPCNIQSILGGILQLCTLK